MYVCACVFMCRSRCTTIDGATKSLRQAECMVSVRNIRLSSICVCVCVFVCARLNGEDTDCGRVPAVS